MSGSNCCFLTCIQISRGADMVVWYCHFFKKFPQFVVIHRVKGFSIVNEAEIDIFLEFPCFLYDLMNVGNLILVPVPSRSSVQFSPVAQSCLTVWDPRDCSMPGLPVHYQLPELTQTHVHWVSDAIQPSHPLSSPSPPTFNLSQHLVFIFYFTSSVRAVFLQAMSLSQCLNASVQFCREWVFGSFPACGFCG